MTKPDYSKWLTYERLQAEEVQWADPDTRTWPEFVDWIRNIAQADEDVQSIVEFGCGTGWVPANLPAELHYVGIDSNPHCLALAMKKNRGRLFSLADIRDNHPLTYDIACAFSVLKHFELHEWDTIVAKVLRCGVRYGLFSMPVAEDTKDDGIMFPHVWVTEQRLVRAVEKAGHTLMELAPLATGERMAVTSKWE